MCSDTHFFRFGRSDSGKFPCAGFFAYLVSSWPPERKQAFYSAHKFLGGATLISGLLSACIGWGAEQIYLMAISGPHMEWFFCPDAYTASLMLIPVFGILLFALGVLVALSYTVFEEQAIPLAGRVQPHCPEAGKVSETQLVPL